MLKIVGAALISSCALFLGTGVANAGPVEDEINLYSFLPGTVQYLNAVKALGIFGSEADVDGAVSLGITYCYPTVPGEPMPLPQRKQLVVDTLTDIETVAPGTKTPWLNALNTYCSNF